MFLCAEGMVVKGGVVMTDKVVIFWCRSCVMWKIGAIFWKYLFGYSYFRSSIRPEAVAFHGCA